MPVTYDSIATVVANGSVSTISFTSIPTTFTDLRLVLSAGSLAFAPRLTFNSSSAANYNRVALFGVGSGTGLSQREQSSTYFALAGMFDPSTTVFSTYELDIFSYRSGQNKVMLANNSCNDGEGGDNGMERSVCVWRLTDAITSIQLVCGSGASNWTAGTTASLYGIKNA
jgi:hypothetical protein